MANITHYAPNFLLIVNGTRLEYGRSLDILSVSVTDTNDRADSFAFSVCDRHPDAGRLFAGGDQLHWMDSATFREGNEVEIHLGYVEETRLMMRGRINAMTPSFPESGLPTLQVEGFSYYQDLHHHRRRKPFESPTDSGIAEEIAQMMGWQPMVDDTVFRHPLYSPQGATYAEILQKRAARINYEMVVKDRTLYFQKPGYHDRPSPALTFEWGRNLLSFSPRMTTHGLVTQVKARAAQTARGNSKVPLVGIASAGRERVRMGQQTASEVAAAVHRENAYLLDLHDLGSQQEANDVALAQLERLSLEFISGSGAVVGNPQLMARMMIQLLGLGKRFSGLYYVTSTTHTIDSGGYRTAFAVKRNAQWI